MKRAAVAVMMKESGMSTEAMLREFEQLMEVRSRYVSGESPGREDLHRTSGGFVINHGHALINLLRAYGSIENAIDAVRGKEVDRGGR